MQNPLAGPRFSMSSTRCNIKWIFAFLKSSGYVRETALTKDFNSCFAASKFLLSKPVAYDKVNIWKSLFIINRSKRASSYHTEIRFLVLSHSNKSLYPHINEIFAIYLRQHTSLNNSQSNSSSSGIMSFRTNTATCIHNLKSRPTYEP